MIIHDVTPVAIRIAGAISQSDTIYNVFKNKLVAEQTARKVCGVLGILFEEGLEPSKSISGLSNKTIKHRYRLISAILNQAVF